MFRAPSEGCSSPKSRCRFPARPPDGEPSAYEMEGPTGSESAPAGGFYLVAGAFTLRRRVWHDGAQHKNGSDFFGIIQTPEHSPLKVSGSGITVRRLRQPARMDGLPQFLLVLLGRTVSTYRRQPHWPRWSREPYPDLRQQRSPSRLSRTYQRPRPPASGRSRRNGRPLRRPAPRPACGRCR